MCFVYFKAALGKLELSVNQQQRLEQYQRSLQDLVDHCSSKLSERNLETDEQPIVAENIEMLKVMFYILQNIVLYSYLHIYL